MDWDIPKIGEPAKRALQNIGIAKFADLEKCSEKQLMDLHGFGPKALRILKEAMKKRGMRFRVET